MAETVQLGLPYQHILRSPHLSDRPHPKKFVSTLVIVNSVFYSLPAAS